MIYTLKVNIPRSSSQRRWYQPFKDSKKLLQIYESCTTFYYSQTVIILPYYLTNILKNYRICLLRLKDEFFDVFKLWLSQIKFRKDGLYCFQINGDGEFINTRIKKFCNKKRINIWYIIFYIHEENDTVK